MAAGHERIQRGMVEIGHGYPKIGRIRLIGRNPLLEAFDAVLQ